MSGWLSTMRGPTGPFSRMWLPVWVLAVIAAASVALAITVQDCGGPGASPLATTTPATATPDGTRTPFATASPPVKLTELRVAYINLMSPISLDANDTSAADTFEQRIELLIEELRQFKPDIVAFSEASWTKETGYASERLVAGLRMEPYFVRANPWFPGQSREESEALVKLQGFEEGELVLVKSPLTILEGSRESLNPRTSETEGRAALHLVVGAPAPLGRINVYVTHLTGGDERLRSFQAGSLLRFIERTRGDGPVLIMGDLSDQPESSTVERILDAGFVDVFDIPEPEPPGEEPGTEPGSNQPLPTPLDPSPTPVTSPTPGAGTPPAQGDDGEEGDEPLPEPAPWATCCRLSVLAEQQPVLIRTSYIFTNGLLPPAVQLFGTKPRTRADGTLLYLSDHNGLYAVFPLEPASIDPNATTLHP